MPRLIPFHPWGMPTAKITEIFNTDCLPFPPCFLTSFPLTARSRSFFAEWRHVDHRSAPLVLRLTRIFSFSNCFRISDPTGPCRKLALQACVFLPQPFDFGFERGDFLVLSLAASEAGGGHAQIGAAPAHSATPFSSFSSFATFAVSAIERDLISAKISTRVSAMAL